MRLLTALHVVLGALTTVIAIPTSLSAKSLGPTSQLQERSLLSSKAALSQVDTNGNSVLGTYNAPHFKQFRGQNTSDLDLTTGDLPWGAKTVANTNVYNDGQDTGVIRYYDWTVERANLAPDGVARSMILVNGAFPGPTIEANWGDTISVTVHNKITGPEEGTSIHWHGFLQTGKPWEDGVPGITQCPIAPGESYTYLFKAELYGTSWWHAHYSAQYSSGVYGAIVIHGPTQPEAQYNTDLGPVLIADYYHTDYLTLVKQVMGKDQTNTRVYSDNNLINGKGTVNCSTTTVPLTSIGNLSSNGSCTPNAGLSKFYFTSGQTHRLRLINAGSEGTQKFSIDDHDLTVIAYDFVPIVPYTTKVITLGVGQRADIIVNADQGTTGAFWMRSTMSSAKCSLFNQPNALAVVYYENADTTTLPVSVAQVDTTDPCANDDLTTAVPYYSMTPPATPDQVMTVGVNITVNSTGSTVWTVNNSTFRTDYNTPILHEALASQVAAGTDPFPEEWNVLNFGNSKSIRIVINNLTPVVHPMHIHGHNMYVLSATSTQPATFTPVNPSNPTRRDTQILPAQGQIVIQIDADNPGVWPLHCHVAWHVSGGLYMNILERPDLIPTLALPQANTDLCTKWNAFTSRAVPDQLDSGLKMRTRTRSRVVRRSV